MRGIPSNRQGTCEMCGKVFQLRGWRQRYCASCKPIAYREYARKQNSAYYHRNPEKVKLAIKRTRAKRPEYYREQKRKNQVRRRERLRRLVVNHYSNGSFACACCGESGYDFLTIDHVNGDGGKHRTALFGTPYRAGSVFYGWLVRNQFPLGFQVLCMNCNLSKGKHGYCVHKTPTANSVTDRCVCPTTKLKRVAIEGEIPTDELGESLYNFGNDYGLRTFSFRELHPEAPAIHVFGRGRREDFSLPKPRQFARRKELCLEIDSLPRPIGLSPPS